MQYCNDCFAKMNDNALHCKSCQSRDIRPFVADVSTEQAPGIQNEDARPVAESHKRFEAEQLDVKEFRLDPKYLIEPKKDESKHSNRGTLYFPADKKTQKKNASRSAKAQRKSRRAAIGSSRARKFKRTRTGFLNSLGNVIGAVTGVLLIGLFGSYYLISGASWLPSLGLAPDSFNAWGFGGDFVAGFQEEPKRLLPAVESNGKGTYKLLDVGKENEQPTWDPCRPINWVVNPTDEPKGARRQLISAVADMEARTGLKFEYLGETTEEFELDRGTKNVLYKDLKSSWNPVIVTYLKGEDWDKATRATTKLSGDLVAGFAGPEVAWSQGMYQKLVYVTGAVTLSTDAFTEMFRWGEPDQAKAVMLHEFGHLVGLDHVNKPSELMFEDNNGLTTWGQGDLSGLSAMGNGSCLKAALYPVDTSLTIPTMTH